MNIYTITGVNKAEFLANARNVISTSMSGVLQYANEDDENIWFSIVGSANYFRIRVSGTDPAFHAYAHLTDTISEGPYIRTFVDAHNQILYFVKFSGGEVGITSSLSSDIRNFLNLKLHNLTTGIDYTGYMVSGNLYINDVYQSIFQNEEDMLITRGTTDSLGVRPPIFFPYLFSTSNGHEWMWKNVLCTFVRFGALKKMLYNGNYWRQITSGEICYYIKDGE